MPKPVPIEFRRDVVAVARKRQAPLWQVAKDFGIFGPAASLAEASRHRRRSGPGVSEAGLVESRSLRRRNMLLEQENEILAARRRCWPARSAD